jgi:hypothetical protein
MRLTVLSWLVFPTRAPNAGSSARSTAALCAVLLACQPAVRSEPEPARCGPTVPAIAQHPIAVKATALAGDYDLIQVRTQPAGGKTTLGRLHLASLDSAARAAAVGGAVRDLIGWLEPAGGDATWRAIVSSRDPARPGAVLAGQHLRLGQIGDLDGYREHLTITAVAPQSFWGWWKADRGLGIGAESGTRRIPPDPAGYFCALRVVP